MYRRFIVVLAALAALLVVAPAASADSQAKTYGGSSTYGKTTLEVDPGTLEALGSLGVAPGVVAPAKLNGATYAFPIVNPLRNAVRTGVVRHRGGISLSAGETVVELTDFDINLPERQLFGRVNGSAPVALLDLDYSRLGIRFRNGKINIGPVGTELTAGAADALNQAFGTDALTDEVALGDATIRYRLFGL